MRAATSTFALGCLLLAASLHPAKAEPPGARTGSAAAPKQLDAATWQEAEGLLPPEILRHYRNGEYANPLIEWSEDFCRISLDPASFDS